MNNFYEEISALTTNNLETRIQLERQKQEDNNEKIKSAIDALFSMLTDSENYKLKVTEAASKGYNKCILFEFDQDQKDATTNLPLVFIFKGPKYDKGQGYGLRFFDNLDIVPLLRKLNTEFAPFKVYFSFIHKTKKYRLELLW